MNREYMIKAVNDRLTELKQQYRNACKNISITGKELTYNGAACLRKRLKKDICTLSLIAELLKQYKGELTDPDAILGFEKLVRD